MTSIKALPGSIVFLPILFILFLTSSALGYSLKKITVIGSARIAEADIIKATGLRSGSTITADDLKKAADRLTQSGVFGQVNYKFDGESVEYTVADADQFVPLFLRTSSGSPTPIWAATYAIQCRLFTGVVALSGTSPTKCAPRLIPY